MTTQTRTAKKNLAQIAGKIAAKSRDPQKPTINAAEVQLMVVRMEEARAAAKALYTEADALEDQLIDLLNGIELRTPDGRIVRVNDRYIDKDGRVKNKAVAIAMSKRFEVVAK